MKRPGLIALLGIACASPAAAQYDSAIGRMLVIDSVSPGAPVHSLSDLLTSRFPGVLVWSSVRLRPKAEKLRVKVDDHLGALLPGTPQERSWFGAVSVGAGISEELCFRGFLLYYLAAYLPNTATWQRVLVTAIVFALAHIYQGWKPAIGTGVLGLILAGLYLLTRSLFLPMVVHAAVDLRVLLIFRPQPSPRLAEQGSA